MSPSRDVVVYRVPLATRFRGLTERDGVLVRGPAGWAEFSPFWDYDDDACRPWWRAAREAADVGWPAPVRDVVPVNVTVPAVGLDQARAIVAGAGCLTAKVKIAEPGQTPADDVARLEAVRDALGPAGRIRVDANGAWGVDTAIARIRALDRAAGGLEYVEQPCATVAELARVRRAVDVPIAADEAVRLAADPLAVVRAEAADVVVLKVQPLGGVRACLELAERMGLPVVVSSALETSVGLAAGLALAAALPDLRYACGLATARLLAADLVADPLLPVDGAIAVRRPEPDPALLTSHAGDEVLVARWRARIAAVAGESAVAGKSEGAVVGDEAGSLRAADSPGTAGSRGTGGSPGAGGSSGAGGSRGAAGSSGAGGSSGATGSPGAGGSSRATGSPGAAGSPADSGSPEVTG